MGKPTGPRILEDLSRGKQKTAGASTDGRADFFTGVWFWGLFFPHFPRATNDKKWGNMLALRLSRALTHTFPYPQPLEFAKLMCQVIMCTDGGM